MKQTYIEQLKDHVGEEVTLKGWLYNSRSSGKLVFMQLRDGTGIVQCVVFKGNNEEIFEKAKGLGQESSIVVTGTVKTDDRSSIGVETRTQNLSVILDTALSPTVFNQARVSFGRTDLQFPEFATSPFLFEASVSSSVFFLPSPDGSPGGPLTINATTTVKARVRVHQ